MMKKKWLGLALAVCAMASVLTGCGSAGSDGAIKLKIATVGNESHQSTIAATAFKEKLEELAGDRFEITIYPNAQLGGEREMAEGVKIGSIATQNRKGKTYRTRNGIGKRKDVKRAIVTVREGTIDIFGDQA